MGKQEDNDRRKAHREQTRVSHSNDPGIQDDHLVKLVKKVIETTRCTQGEAEIALFDNENNVDAAVLSILDRGTENGNNWTENKGKKSKKPDANEKEEQYNRRGPRGNGNRNRAPGGNALQQEPRKDRQQREERQPRENRQKREDRQPRVNGRGPAGNVRGGNHQQNKENVWKESSSEDQKAPAIETFNSAETSSQKQKDEVNSWKGGPRVFESSVQQQLNSSVPSTVPSAVKVNEKPTFASVAAAKKTVVPPPPQPAVKKTALPPPLQPVDVRQITEPTGAEAHAVAAQSNEMTKPAASSSVIPNRDVPSSSEMPEKESVCMVPSASFGSTAVSTLSVNKEFTDKLKNDIGLGSATASTSNSANAGVGTTIYSSPPSSSQNPNVLATDIRQQKSEIKAQPGALLHGVEFVSGDDTSMAIEFQFGFHADSPSVARDAGSLPDQDTQNRLRDAPSSLAYANTRSEDYSSVQVNDTRQTLDLSSGSTLANKSQNLQQSMQLGGGVGSVQQQSSYPQHPTLQQQQQQMYNPAAQFPGYAYPYLGMYSPVAGMRDVEQYTAALNQFPYGLSGMNQLDLQLGAMLPSLPQQTAAAAQSGGGLNMGHHQSQTTPAQQTQHRSSQENKYPSQQNVTPTNGNGLQSTTNSNSTYQGMASGGQQHNINNQTGIDTASLNNGGGNAVAPPPGFSGPPTYLQQSFQSLFQLPSTFPQQILPVMVGGGQQRQPQSHHIPQSGLQQQYQRGGAADHSYMDKYPTNVNTNNGGFPPNSAYQGLSGAGGGGGGGQLGNQQRNMLNQQGNGGGLDNSSSYYPNRWR